MSEELERDLGLISVIAISMGAMIGSGIFILPGLAMAETGPSVILAFVVAAILVLPAAISIAELGTAMPEAGGDYIFIERGMGPGAGTIAGLGTWLMLMFKGALALVGGMLYLGPVFARFGYTVTEFQLELLAVVIGIVLITVNVIGVKQTGGLQKVLVLVMLFILGGFVAVSMGSIDGGSYDPFFEFGLTGLFGATAMVLISYGGVTKVAAVAEEIERPGRNLPLGLLISLGLTTALYALIVFVLVGIVAPEELLGSETPMVDGVEPFFGFLGIILIVVAAMFALISTANAGILTASRYPFALSRDHLLPEFFAGVSDRFHTPTPAILTTGIAMLVIIVLLPVEEIAKTAGAFQIVVYILVCLALIVFRRRPPTWYDPDFRSPLYPWLQLFGVASGLFILTQMDTLPLIGGIGIVVLGGLWYQYYGRERVDRTGMMSEEVIETVTPTEEDGEKPYRIVVPIANPQTQRGLLVLAAAHASYHEPAEVVVMNVITVPEQTSLAQEVGYEEERIARQQDLLQASARIVEEQDVGLRTRAIVGRDVGETILSVIEQESADAVMMGWSGERKARERVLGSNIDQILDNAPCDVSLVRHVGNEPGKVLGLVAGGPYSPTVARKAANLVAASEGASLTLANVQRRSQDESEATAAERGRKLVDEVASRTGVEDYERRVEVSEDVPGTMIEIAREYDTIILGVSRVSSVERILSGTIPDRIGERVSGTVVLVRGAEPTDRPLRRAIAARLLK